MHRVNDTWEDGLTIAREGESETEPKPLDLGKFRTQHMLGFILYCEENLFV